MAGEEIIIERHSNEIRRMLKSAHLQDQIKKLVGDEIAADTEASARADGKDWTYEAIPVDKPSRGAVQVGTYAKGSNFSELKHGYLLKQGYKNRGQR